MKRIAPDIDRLMWTLAEARDLPAIAEFEGRFPDLRLELAKRVALVGGLRGARFEQGPPAPRFQPSARPQPLWGRPLALAAGLAALAVLASGAFVGTRALLASRGGEPGPGASNPAVLEPSSPTHSNPPDSIVVPPPEPSGPLASAADPEPPAFLKPISVRIEDAPLLAVVQAIASQSGLSLEVAPGMPNFNVTASYSGIAGVRMLQDLGRKYGFSVLGQGGNNVLLIPVVDESATGEPLAGPSSIPASGTRDGG